MVAEQYHGVAALRERAYGPVPAGQLVVLQVRAMVGQERRVPQERYAPRAGRQRLSGAQLSIRRVGQAQRGGHHVQPQFATVSAVISFGHGLRHVVEGTKGRREGPDGARGEQEVLEIRKAAARCIGVNIIYW